MRGIERRISKIEARIGSDAGGQERQRIALALLIDARHRALCGVPAEYPPETEFLRKYRTSERTTALRGHGRGLLNLAERLKEARLRSHQLSPTERREDLQRRQREALERLREMP